MKTSVLIQNGVTTSTVDLIFSLVKLIPWPDQRRAMGDVTLSLLSCLKPVVALDHDMHPVEKLTPGGILEAVSGQAFLFFTA